MQKKIFLLAPAGCLASLQAAINVNADMIYFGIDKLNMRQKSAHNFAISDLEKVVYTIHQHNKQAYLTLNSIIYDEDIALLKKTCDEAKKCGVDSIIASDMATISYAHSIGLNINISTQLNVCNIEAVKFYAKYANVILLARELTLDQIKNIATQVEKEKILGPNGQLVKLEIFAHGALCVSISGKCYMSLALYNSSANRGECLQPCRRQYLVKDMESDQELKIDNNFIMSPKDLCTLPFLDQIVKSGISILKIEGRARGPEYVKSVVQCYREALDSIYNNNFTKEKMAKWEEELKKVYNRGFWKGGYYLGEKLGEWSGAYGSLATTKKTYIGKIIKYFPKIGVVECQLHSGTLKENDPILIIGPVTGVISSTIEQIRMHKERLITFRMDKRVKTNDSVYLVEKNVR
jgi:putative protease